MEPGPNSTDPGPEPVHTQRAALIVVDVQNDFADPAGSLYVKRGEEVLPVANREIARALETGALVVYTQDWHPSHTPHFAPDGGVWPVHCVQDTWGAELHPDLHVAGPVIRKGSGGEDGYSGFSARDPLSGDSTSTALEALLREAAIEKLLVLGLAGDYCVGETALDGRRLGFDVEIISEGVRFVEMNEGDAELMWQRLNAAGVRSFAG